MTGVEVFEVLDEHPRRSRLGTHLAYRNHAGHAQRARPRAEVRRDWGDVPPVVFPSELVIGRRASQPPGEVLDDLQRLVGAHPFKVAALERPPAVPCLVPIMLDLAGLDVLLYFTRPSRSWPLF